jgi:hypothetical protein
LFSVFIHQKAENRIGLKEVGKIFNSNKMKNVAKQSIVVIFLIALIAVLGVANVNAQELKPISEVRGKIKEIKGENLEKQVTNINEVKAYINFNKKTPIKDGRNIIGYQISSGSSKGHRRSGGCCQFNGGWCGKFSGVDVSIDLLGNITKSTVKMFIGFKNDAEYVRFEGLSEEDLKDEPVK